MLRALARAAGNPLTAVSSAAASGGDGGAGGGETKASSAGQSNSPAKAAAAQRKPARGAPKRVRLTQLATASAVKAQVRAHCFLRLCDASEFVRPQSRATFATSSGTATVALSARAAITSSGGGGGAGLSAMGGRWLRRMFALV